MTRWLILALCLLTRSAAAAGTDDAWAAYRFAPDALAEIDLASDTAWTLSLDGGPARAIRVTAGGWNSDFQSPLIASDAIKDYAVYERKIYIPPAAAGKVVKRVTTRHIRPRSPIPAPSVAPRLPAPNSAVTCQLPP